MTGPADWFTGQVGHALFPPDGGRHSSGGVVTFAPGARTRWLHTLQVRRSSSPRGWLGSARREALWKKLGRAMLFSSNRRETLAWCLGQVGMVHIAVTEVSDGKAVDWLEPVPDEQYSK